MRVKILCFSLLALLTLAVPQAQVQAQQQAGDLVLAYWDHSGLDELGNPESPLQSATYVVVKDGDDPADETKVLKTQLVSLQGPDWKPGIQALMAGKFSAAEITEVMASFRADDLTVLFDGLPPGSYSIAVKASDSNGNWSVFDATDSPVVISDTTPPAPPSLGCKKYKI